MLYIDHLSIDTLVATKKGYKYVLTVVDGFTKFTWIFPLKTLTIDETLKKLKIIQSVFGNPRCFMTDRGASFRSKSFEEYCDKEDIKHFTIATGQPRGNGQVEIINRIIINIMTKISIEDPTKWFSHVDKVQRFINSTLQRSIKTTPFEVMFGTKMRHKEDQRIIELIDDELLNNFIVERDLLRQDAAKNILKIQEENRKQFNKRRRTANKYQIGDLVAIQRTQFGSGSKLRNKFYGPYKVLMKKPHDRYDVQRCDGTTEGPRTTVSTAEQMKPWPSTCLEKSSEADDSTDGRVVVSSVRNEYNRLDKPPSGSPCITGYEEQSNRNRHVE